VLLRRDLRRKPVALQIAGERLVLFRDDRGQAAALQDRCPHRGVALSLGETTPDGALRCPFHGWEFNRRGACMHVPFNPTAKRARLGATAFPVHEEGGLVWLYTAPLGPAVPPPYVPVGLRPAKLSLFALEVTWETHWTRAMIDGAHVPFVHRRTIGRILARKLQRDSRLDVGCRPTDHGAFITGVQDGEHIVGLHEFNRPNGMVLYVDGAPARIRVHIFCIPVHARCTRLMVVAHFGRSNWLARLFCPLNRFIVQEDREVVSSSQPAEVPPPGVEKSVETDRGTLFFRKYYHEVLKRDPAASAEVEVAPAMPAARSHSDDTMGSPLVLPDSINGAGSGAWEAS
jgi:phenylpropionate dioxygenase-like ring-hydroxylating dioxygenase large terminal subunit